MLDPLSVPRAKPDWACIRLDCLRDGRRVSGGCVASLVVAAAGARGLPVLACAATAAVVPALPDARWLNERRTLALLAPLPVLRWREASFGMRLPCWPAAGALLSVPASATGLALRLRWFVCSTLRVYLCSPSPRPLAGPVTEPADAASARAVGDARSARRPARGMRDAAGAGIPDRMPPTDATITHVHKMHAHYKPQTRGNHAHATRRVQANAGESTCVRTECKLKVARHTSNAAVVP